MALRIKLHGQPDETDLSRVRRFRAENAGAFSPEVIQWFGQLETDLEYVYHKDNLADRLNRFSQINTLQSGLIKKITAIKNAYEKKADGAIGAAALSSLLNDMASLLCDIRSTIAHHRIEAMRTGIAKPGFGQFANPIMQRWARITKLIKD